ncbi:replication initiation protein [Actinoplanes hulinensis]|uniref:Replication initiation protein n=1 Tax=Actinoplanes hulinensis TaxID=1144547 RepID=A0ABS7AWQ3_9ACTN|nr:replication initiator [Actinoplanes hulinensis]MBW6433077.1 replication initiation protein [Actinoplanes hulinensis]
MHFTDQEVLATATHPDFRAWLARIKHIGGCQHPIHLIGHTLTLEAGTGRLLAALTSETQPHKRLTIACGNRRVSRCEPCARLHQGDTYHLIAAGLAGGKSIPDTVRTHPRVFATFTAPSFGAVHRHTTDGPCRSRKRTAPCPHGRPLACPAHHTADDPVTGTPLCLGCYDYRTAVLFNAHTRDLWQRLNRNLYEDLASTLGVSRSVMRRSVRVSYAKVAEWQRRGTIHFHSVVRFDGPEGPTDPPPAWASTGLLIRTIRSATGRVFFTVPGTQVVLRFGTQLDIRPITPGRTGDDLTERAVASYIAKYVSKPEVTGVTVDRPIRDLATIAVLPVTEHTRTMIRTCWALGFRRWAHQLGYRGHTATKSRRYSTTYTALRAARADHRRSANGEDSDTGDAVVERNWRYSHSGHTVGQAMFAEGIEEDLRAAREDGDAS